MVEIVADPAAVDVAETGRAVVNAAEKEVPDARKNAGTCRWAMIDEDGWNALAVRSWKARLVPSFQLRTNMVLGEMARRRRNEQLMK